MFSFSKNHLYRNVDCLKFYCRKHLLMIDIQLFASVEILGVQQFVRFMPAGRAQKFGVEFLN